MSDAASPEVLESQLLRIAEQESDREAADRMVAALGAHLGLPDLHLNEEGLAWLTVEKDVDLSLLHSPSLPGLIAAATMPVAAATNHKVLRALLRANHSWPASGGGVFAMAPGVEAPILLRLLPGSEDGPAALDGAIAEFVALVRDWQTEIADRVDEPDGTASAGVLPAVPPLRV